MEEDGSVHVEALKIDSMRRILVENGALPAFYCFNYPDSDMS